MNLTFNFDKFNSVCSTVLRPVTSYGDDKTILQLTGDKLKVYAFSGRYYCDGYIPVNEVNGTCEVNQWYIDGCQLKTVLNIVAKMQADTITLSIGTEQGIIVLANKSRFTIPLINLTTEIPKIKAQTLGTVDKDDLVDLFKSTAKVCISQDIVSGTAMACVHLFAKKGELVSMATDGVSLIEKKIQMETEQETEQIFLLEPSQLDILSLTDDAVTLVSNDIGIGTVDSMGNFTFVQKKSSAPIQYEPIKKVVCNNQSISVDKKDFTFAVSSVVKLCPGIDFIEFDVKGGFISVLNTNGDDMKVACKGAVKDITFRLKKSSLINLLFSVSDDFYICWDEKIEDKRHIFWIQNTEEEKKAKNVFISIAEHS